MSHPDLSHTRLLAVSDAAPSRNGAGAYYQDLLEQMEGRLEKTVLCSPTIDEEGKWQAGFILPLPGDKTQKLCFPNIWKMNRLFDDLKPDIVVIATPGVYGITGAYVARERNIPYLTGMHTSFEKLTHLYWPDSLRGKIVEQYFRLSNGYLFRHTEAVLGNSDPVLTLAKEMGAPGTLLVGTPISSEFIKPEHPQYQGTFESCLFAGRLAREKNLDALLDVVGSFPGINFSVAGDGPLRPMIESAVEKYTNLVYLGWLSREDLRKTVDSHDALILPSHFETFGTIALEAMAREKLVVVSGGCGITHWDSLLPGLILIDETGLKKCFDRILDKTAEERREIAVTANKLALDWQNEVMDDWCRMIQETVSRHAQENGKE